MSHVFKPAKQEMKHDIFKAKFFQHLLAFFNRFIERQLNKSSHQKIIDRWFTHNFLDEYIC